MTNPTPYITANTSHFMIDCIEAVAQENNRRIVKITMRGEREHEIIFSELSEAEEFLSKVLSQITDYKNR